MAVLAIVTTACTTRGMSTPKVDQSGKVDTGFLRAALAQPNGTLPVIVREADPASQDAEDLVGELGGTVDRDLPIVGGFSATVPSSAVPALVESSSVWRLWGDASLRMSTIDMTQFDSAAINSVWQNSVKLAQARLLSIGKYLGQGVTVAVLDTGVSKVADLGNRVLARVDFTPDHDGYDRFGHGTHMAGLIAGDGSTSLGVYQGVATAANIVSVKVAGADGSTDVSVVLGGLGWIVDHRARTTPAC